MVAIITLERLLIRALFVDNSYHPYHMTRISELEGKSGYGAALSGYQVDIPPDILNVRDPIRAADLMDRLVDGKLFVRVLACFLQIFFINPRIIAPEWIVGQNMVSSPPGSAYHLDLLIE